MTRARLTLMVALLALAASRAYAVPSPPPSPPPAPALEGVWTATTAGGQVLRGFWTAELTVATPNVGVGTWTLLNGLGDVMMNGTWSARQAPHGWRGAWSARLAGTNQLISGTWDADDSTLKGAKTFRDMLARTADKQIAGVWHMGRTHGNWWLKSRT